MKRPYLVPVSVAMSALSLSGAPATSAVAQAPSVSAPVAVAARREDDEAVTLPQAVPVATVWVEHAGHVSHSSHASSSSHSSHASHLSSSSHASHLSHTSHFSSSGGTGPGGGGAGGSEPTPSPSPVVVHSTKPVQPHKPKPSPTETAIDSPSPIETTRDDGALPTDTDAATTSPAAVTPIRRTADVGSSDSGGHHPVGGWLGLAAGGALGALITRARMRGRRRKEEGH